MKFECLYYKLMVRETFMFMGREWKCYYHPYNRTPANERQVELPAVAELILSKPGRLRRCLEVGHTLGHYESINRIVKQVSTCWTTVDKYERAAGVLNQDLFEHEPEELYDLIVSVSTVEHIGVDEARYAALYGSTRWAKNQPNPQCIVEKLQSMLASQGRLIITFTPGFNPEWDDWFLSKRSTERASPGYNKGWTLYHIRDPKPVYIMVYDAP
jgi:hypothetical protein